MNNRILRTAMFEHQIKQYHLANILGVSPSYVSSMLRWDLSEEEQLEIVRKIEDGIDNKDKPAQKKAKPKTNIEVREELAKHGLAQWQLAEALGISDTNLNLKLRKELPYQEKRRLIWIINNRAKYMAMIGLTEPEEV